MPVAILLLLTNYLSSFTLNFAANTRLPMCAGWDHLLPAWFTRLHAQTSHSPVEKTPSCSWAGSTLAMSVIILIGVNEQEGFELLQIWSFAFYGIAYLALFAIPIFALRNPALRFALWLRIAATSGLIVTALFVALSIFPIIPVASQSAYTLKTAAALILANAAGFLLYRLRPRGI